jgi:catechol 2,3-dioxygenase-like lactoylglutathione lyase family enzyme
MSKTSICYLRLVVGDPEALARFYCDVFGMEVVRRFDALAADDPHLEIFLSAGGKEGDHQFALMHYLNRPTPKPGEVEIAFMVEDLDAVVAAAEAAGGVKTKAAETLEDHKIRYAVIADPEGHSIDVMQFVG